MCVDKSPSCFHSNLIQPPGMMLRPAVFDLRVFRAEDIPQSKLCCADNYPDTAFICMANKLIVSLIYCLQWTRLLVRQLKNP